MIRLSTVDPSKKFNVETVTTNGFRRAYKTKFSNWLFFICDLFSKSIKKILYTFLVIMIFGWFNINNKKISESVASIAIGDISGFAGLLDATEIKKILKEMYKVLFNAHNNKNKSFVYVGNDTLILNRLVSNKDVSDGDCDNICDKAATYASVEEAEEFCSETLNARLPTYAELKTIIGSNNPITKFRINNEILAEWTSTVSSDDSDNYQVYTKNKEQFNILSQYADDLNTGLFIDEDNSSAKKNIGFRCIIKL